MKVQIKYKCKLRYCSTYHERAPFLQLKIFAPEWKRKNNDFVQDIMQSWFEDEWAKANQYIRNKRLGVGYSDIDVCYRILQDNFGGDMHNFVKRLALLIIQGSDKVEKRKKEFEIKQNALITGGWNYMEIIYDNTEANDE